MSSYLSFYLRKKGTDVYVPLYSISRSNYLYQAFDDEFGSHTDKKGTCLPISQADLNVLHRRLETQLCNYTNRITELENQLKEIGSWNNSVEEKLEAIAQRQEYIDGYKEEREYVNYAVATVSVFMSIEEEQYKPEHPILYAGIDGHAPDYKEGDEE